jgi:hypothetical protein
MTVSVEKLAPRLIALAVVGYSIWPSIMAFVSEPENKPVAKPPELEALLLSPKMTPEPKRDPFHVSEMVASSTKSQAGVAGKKATGVAGTKTLGAPRNPLDGLRLDGTCVAGSQRLAVINGRLYAVRDALPATGAAAALKVVQVLPHKVLLQRNGETLELRYSSAAAREAGTPAGETQSGSRGRGKPAPRKSGDGAKPATHPKTRITGTPEGGA